MKLADIDELAKIQRQLKAIQNARDWLNSFHDNGIKVQVDATAIPIQLSREASFKILFDREQEYITRLQELGVER